MKKRVHFFLSLIVLATVISCAGTKPALINGNNVSNPTMGSNGYRFQVPEGFVYQSRTQAVQSSDIADMAIKDFYQRLPFSDGQNIVGGEALAFKQGRQSLFFSVSFLAVPQIDGAQKEMLLNMMKGLITSDGTISCSSKNGSEVVRVNGQDAVLVECRDKKTSAVFETYFFFGDINEVFMLSGLAPVSEKETMKQIVKTVLETVKV